MCVTFETVKLESGVLHFAFCSLLACVNLCLALAPPKLIIQSNWICENGLSDCHMRLSNRINQQLNTIFHVDSLQLKLIHSFMLFLEFIRHEQQQQKTHSSEFFLIKSLNLRLRTTFVKANWTKHLSHETKKVFFNPVEGVKHLIYIYLYRHNCFSFY